MNLIVIVFVAFGVTIASGQSYLSNARFKVQLPGSTTPSALDVVNNLASGSIALPSQPSNQLANRDKFSNAAPGTIPNNAFPVVVGQQGPVGQSSGSFGQPSGSFGQSQPINNGIAPTFSDNSINRPTTPVSQDYGQNFGGFRFPPQSGFGGHHGFNGFGNGLGFHGQGFSGFSGNGIGSPFFGRRRR